MRNTCISTKIFTAVDLGYGQNVRVPLACLVEELVLSFLSSECPFEWSVYAPLLSEGWRAPRNPGSTDKRQQQFIKCSEW